MKDIKNNPLKSIFNEISEKFSPEIKSINNINNFFIYLKEPKNSQQSKVKILEDFQKLIKENRYLCEYFSFYENKSIYIILFELYLEGSDTLKSSILNLIKELILNIEIDKNIFDYIFQKISSLYREEQPISPNILKDYLSIL